MFTTMKFSLSQCFDGGGESTLKHVTLSVPLDCSVECDGHMIPISIFVKPFVLCAGAPAFVLFPSDCHTFADKCLNKKMYKLMD